MPVPRQYTVNNKSYIHQTVLVCLAHGHQRPWALAAHAGTLARMACPHAAPVPHWPWHRGGGASARDSRSRGEPHRDAHKTQTHRAAARAHRAVARRANARARRAVAGARRGNATARRAAARRANARARRAVVEARRAVHSSCARPSPQSAAGAGAPGAGAPGAGILGAGTPGAGTPGAGTLASRDASRTGAHPTAAAHRNRGYRRCRSVEHRPSRRGGGRNGRAGSPSLAPDPWRPVARDRRDSHGCGRRAAPGPCNLTSLDAIGVPQFATACDSVVNTAG